MMVKKLVALLVAYFFIIPVGYNYLSGNSDADIYNFTEQFDLSNYLAFFYHTLGNQFEKPEPEVFEKAMIGFFALKADHKIENNLLTIIDFSLSANHERMWIVDVDQMKIIHTSLVSHGRNSGELYANRFSNIPSSYQSSLGFYLTGEIYEGKHGMSLYLDGMEQGINDKARARAIVIHSADYVSRDFIEKNGRLGRSLGCPAIPSENHQEIITMLAGRSCMYIYHSDNNYHEASTLIKNGKSATGMNHFLKELPTFMASVATLSTSTSVSN